jgi:phage terminase small subunit
MTPPPNSTLTPRQERFKDLYLIDLNATRAYREAYGVKSDAVANAAGSRLLANVKVAAAIQAGKAAVAARAQISAADVLQLIWDTATADPRELIEYRRTCCRHCHGQGFDYQRTQNEMKRARASYDKDQSKKTVEEAKRSESFDEMGGIGYNATKPPHADCPECFGEGVERAFVHDTRKLSRAALTLYAGVKTTKDGVEIKVHDQQAARITVGKHLGLFKEQEDPQESEEERIKRLRAGLKQMDETTLGIAA